MSVKGYSDLVAVVGNMAGISVGSVLSLKGQWKHDSKYGKQFIVEKYEETLPATALGLEKYLGSGLIKGIGPMYAKKIVSRFGADTLAVIEESPDKLIEVEGIGIKRVEKIKSAWVEQREIKSIMLFLSEHGVSTAYAVKIYKTYRDRSIAVVRENPYRLADDIYGIGFKTADKIAEKLGIGKESYIRCRGGVLFTLNELSNVGHCFATFEQLTKTAAEILDIEEPKIVMTISDMINSKEIIRDEDNTDALYLPPLYYSEVGTVNRLLSIQSAKSSKIKPEISSSLDSMLEKAQKADMRYSDIQTAAIKQAVLSKVMILTGGPGTGKTTTILGIISVLKMLGLEILLAAPTGRAAKRMSETTGMVS